MLWINLLPILLCLSVGTIVLLRFNFTIITVSGDSMYPTLVPGDRLLTVRFWRRKQLRTGQIVIGRMNRLPQPPKLSAAFSALDHSDLPIIIDTTLDDLLPSPLLNESEVGEISLESDHAKFIKRLVGLSGDKIEISVSTLHEIMQELLISIYKSADTLTWTIPKDHCFVRGDGLVSMDSLVLGPIPLDAIEGIVIAKLPRSNKLPANNDDTSGQFQLSEIQSSQPSNAVPSESAMQEYLS